MGFSDKFGRSTTSVAALVALGLTMPVPALVMAQTRISFSDTQNHWARPFIESLAQEGLINGFADRTFQPEQTITRDQFNSILNQVFNNRSVQLPQGFNTTAASYWSSFDFQNNRATSPNQLRGTDNLSRLQVLMAITNGLGLTPTGNPQSVLAAYQDASRIPSTAAGGLTAATENGLVVNYPDVQYFDPNKPATRAEVAAFVYQALVSQDIFDPISSRTIAARYIVQPGSIANNPNSPTTSNPVATNPQNIGNRIAINTVINVRYPQAQKIVLTPGENQNLTLLVTENIVNSQGQVLIPRDSQIDGQITSRFNGSQFLGAQFVAQRLVVGNQAYNFNAVSRLVSSQPAEAVNQQSGVGDTLISAAARAILGSVTGGGGGGLLEGLLGSILGGGNRPASNSTGNQLVIINTATDLQLTTQGDLVVGN
ncbi:MAG: S-layer homology domain-containing protein [Coleofasciculaceae cyanobacterium SM2_1_6]|nr:S-layer homology domain-containing protein [Coleofasciculaceae cyanobacterium SM2_1_6]